MNRMVNTSRRQLALLLEHEIRHPLPEEVQEALVTALADLLLEVLGHENPAPADKGEARDEP
jgi:hypothetical protein